MTVYLGRALVGLKPLSVKTANAVYRGDVWLNDGNVYRGFVKDLSVRQLANELLVATLAHRLGVRVPKAALVVISPDASSDFRQIRHSNGSDFVGFCSVDVQGQTIHQILLASGSGILFERIKSAPDMGRMYGFDTWVANIDRHMNNIMISGDGSSFLIDHGHCFSGPDWKKEDLSPSLSYTNRLEDWLTPALTEAEKNSAMADVDELVKSMASTDVAQALQDAMVDALYGTEDATALASFLTDRVGHVLPISANSLGTLL